MAAYVIIGFAASEFYRSGGPGKSRRGFIDLNLEVSKREVNDRRKEPEGVLQMSDGALRVAPVVMEGSNESAPTTS